MEEIITEYEQQFPNLSDLLSNFHQDWVVVFDWEGAEPTFETVVRHYKAICTPDEVRQTTRELERFLTLPLDEEQLSDALDDMFCSYYPMGSGQTYREWLEAVLAVLHEPQEKAREMRYIEGTDTGGWKEYVDEETKRMLNIQ